MPDDTICVTCPDPITDPKSLVQCSLCQASFHTTCAGISDLRGFHMKRWQWKCPSCSPVIDSPDPEKNRKRQRSDSGDPVMVDRNVLADLINTVSALKDSVEGMKKELSQIRNENKTLISLLSSKDEKAGNSKQQNKSYANITKGQGRNDNPDRQPLLQAQNMHKASPRSVVTVEQVSKAVTSALGKLNGSDDQNDGFRHVTPRNKRFRKPAVIGQMDTQDRNGSSVFQSTERRHWVYVGRVHADTTAENIIDFVKSTWSIEDVLCIKLASYDGISSFKVGVRESHIPGLLDAAKWPKGVAVREFVFIPKRGGAAASAAHFQKSDAEAMIT